MVGSPPVSSGHVLWWGLLLFVAGMSSGGVSSCLRCALTSCAVSASPTADEGIGSSRKRSPLDFDEEPEGNG